MSPCLSRRQQLLIRSVVWDESCKSQLNGSRAVPRKTTQVTDLVQQSEQSESESNPEESTAVVTSTIEAENAGVWSPAVLECTRLKSAEAATGADCLFASLLFTRDLDRGPGTTQKKKGEGRERKRRETERERERQGGERERDKGRGDGETNVLFVWWFHCRCTMCFVSFWLKMHIHVQVNFVCKPRRWKEQSLSMLQSVDDGLLRSFHLRLVSGSDPSFGTFSHVALWSHLLCEVEHLDLQLHHRLLHGFHLQGLLSAVTFGPRWTKASSQRSPMRNSPGRRGR